MINLHLATNVATYLGRKLIGLDLTFAQRFTSLDNPVWVATVIAVGFALFEPARAAAASLLVVDGRVRQEGLDLLAAVEQLPVRRPKKPVLGQGAAAALLIALAAAIGFGSGPAWAQEKAGPARLGRAAARGAELRQRFAGVARRCGMSGEVLSRQLDAVDEVAATEHSSLTRLLDDVESFAFDDGNCENARARLRQALPLVVQARDEMRARKAQTETAAQRAQRILARPEFAVDPEKVAQAPEPEKPPSEAPGWWRSFVEWLERVLNKLGPDHGPTVSLPSGGAFSANILVVVVVAGVVIALTYLLISGRRKTAGINEGLEISTTAETGLAADPQSALSRLPEGWAGLADELASRGEFREAVRSLYLALLSKLHRLGAIDYDPAYSNWDYFRGFKGRREWLPPFRELTSRFDFAYYGHLPVDSQGYHAFRTLTQPLLTADSNAEPVGA
jgi:hypothetical protein